MSFELLVMSKKKIFRVHFCSKNPEKKTIFGTIQFSMTYIKLNWAVLLKIRLVRISLFAL